MTNTRKTVACCLLVLTGFLLPALAQAQNLSGQRQLRAYIPPDQLVSFLPSTPVNTFLELINPIFVRVTGKQVIDPDGNDYPIGIAVTSMHFIDALEMVLNYNGYYYRETDLYFMVEAVGVADPLGAITAVSASGGPPVPGGALATTTNPANLATSQVRISAVLFELNHSKAKETGIDWSVIFGEASAQSGGGGSTSGGAGGQEQSVDFFLKTDKLFDGLSDVITAPSSVNFSDLSSLIRIAETQGVGETIASPEVTVQSGIKGRIQIGSDVPVQVRDFAGNTITQFFSTGIIVEVTPTMISEATVDTVGAPVVDFIHLDVSVEKSGSRPSAAGLIIDRSQASTQVVTLDGEQIMIGGLFNTEESVSRRGIPVLRDLPGWFFGLRYIFGRTATTVTQKELLMVLQAEIVDPIATRAARPANDNMLERRRQQVQDALERFNARVQQQATKPKEFKGGRQRP